MSSGHTHLRSGKVAPKHHKMHEPDKVAVLKVDHLYKLQDVGNELQRLNTANPFCVSIPPRDFLCVDSVSCVTLLDFFFEHAETHVICEYLRLAPGHDVALKSYPHRAMKHGQFPTGR